METSGADGSSEQPIVFFDLETTGLGKKEFFVSCEPIRQNKKYSVKSRNTDSIYLILILECSPGLKCVPVRVKIKIKIFLNFLFLQKT